MQSTMNTYSRHELYYQIKQNDKEVIKKMNRNKTIVKNYNFNGSFKHMKKPTGLKRLLGTSTSDFQSGTVLLA